MSILNVPATILWLSKSFNGRRQPRFIKGKKNGQWKPSETDSQWQRNPSPYSLVAGPENDDKIHWNFRHHFISDGQRWCCELPCEEKFDIGKDQTADERHCASVIRRAKDVINAELRQRLHKDREKRKRKLVFLREIYYETTERPPTWFLSILEGGTTLNLSLSPTFPGNDDALPVTDLLEVEDLHDAELELNIGYSNLPSSSFEEFDICEKISFSKSGPDHDWRRPRKSEFSLVSHSTIRRVHIKGICLVRESSFSTFELLLLNEGIANDFARRLFILKGVYRRKMATADKYLSWKIQKWEIKLNTA